MFNLSKLWGSLHSLIHFYEEYLLVTRIMSIFALYNVNKHSMLRQKREESGTGICHVMQGKESKTCPCDFSNRSENRPLIQTHFIGDKTICVVLLSVFLAIWQKTTTFAAN